MSEPTYTGAAGQTLVYAANGGDAAYASLTTMGASPLGSSPRLVPKPSPAVTATPTDATYQALIASPKAGGKAYQIIYPVAADGTQNSTDLALYNCPTQAADVVHYIRAQLKFDAPVTPLTTAFAIKFFKFMCVGIPYTAQQPQYGTHDDLPWLSSDGIYPKRADGTTTVNTYFEALCGFDDVPSPSTNGNDGIQPVGPWLEDLLADGQYHRFVWEWHPHTAAKKLDNVTKLSVSVTATGTAGVGTATFSESMAGRLTNGQVISLKPTGSKSMGGYTVSAFDGTTGCTLTRLVSAQDDFSGTTSTTCALVFDGFMRLWIDGTKVMDVSQDMVGVVPTGAKKSWCNAIDVALLLTDTANDSTENMHWGSVQTNNPREEVRIAYNFGNGDATNADTLAWWTAPYGAAALPADHLAMSVQPAGAVSGVALTTQPVVLIEDASNATVTSDTSTVTAAWVSLTGDASPSGTLTKAASAGVATFTNLALTWTVASTGYWHFTDGSLTSVNSTVLTLPVGAVSSVSTLPTPIDQWRPKPTREGLRVIVSPSPLIGTGGLVAVASNTVSVHIPVGRIQVSVLSLAIDAMVAAAGSGAITATVSKVTASGTVTPLTAATSLQSDVVTAAGNIALPMLASVFGGAADGARRIDGTSGDYLRVDIIAAGTVTTQPQVRIVAELAVTK